MLPARENHASNFPLFVRRSFLWLRSYRSSEQRDTSTSALSFRYGARGWFAPSSCQCHRSLRRPLRHQLGTPRRTTQCVTCHQTNSHHAEGHFDGFTQRQRAVCILTRAACRVVARSLSHWPASRRSSSALLHQLNCRHRAGTFSRSRFRSPASSTYFTVFRVFG